MTIAAKQCREYLETKYDGVRISRRKCKNTSKGGISQHSAYQRSYDSNALDIMGGPYGQTWDENVELIQQVVDDLTENLTGWSIRKILWRIPNHYGHAHIDFYPMIDIHKWCATVGVTPPWRYSDGHRERHVDPEPENGPYNGDTMNLERWATRLRNPKDFDRMAAVGIIDKSEATYFKKVATNNPEMQDLRDAVEVRTPLWTSGKESE